MTRKKNTPEPTAVVPALHATRESGAEAARFICRVRLLREHTHAGLLRRAGEEILIQDEPTLAFLVAHGLVRPEDRGQKTED
jgi:hypothetical protein